MPANDYRQSDVTDSWPIIVRRFGVFDPLKHSAAKGI